MRRGTGILLIALLAAPAMISSRAAIAAGSDQNEVVARIGATDIKAADIRSYIATLAPQDQAALARDPNALIQAVRLLLARQEVLKKALSEKWEERPDVMAEIQRARETVIVESYLGSVSTLPADFPSSAQVESAYEANKTSFLLPRQFDIAQIFIALGKGADKATQDKARAKLASVRLKLEKKNADFGAIAAADSDDPETAKRKGEIGWLFESQVTPEIRSQVEGLAKGSVSEPIQLDDGWHIVKLIDTKPAHTRPLEEVRDQIVAALRQQETLAERRAYMAKLLQQDPPAINELALSKLLAKPPTN
jgi:parvulin-like peptidyl-prolyl isomerase